MRYSISRALCARCKPSSASRQPQVPNLIVALLTAVHHLGHCICQCSLRQAVSCVWRVTGPDRVYLCERQEREHFEVRQHVVVFDPVPELHGSAAEDV